MGLASIFLLVSSGCATKTQFFRVIRIFFVVHDRKRKSSICHVFAFFFRELYVQYLGANNYHLSWWNRYFASSCLIVWANPQVTSPFPFFASFLKAAWLWQTFDGKVNNNAFNTAHTLYHALTFFIYFTLLWYCSYCIIPYQYGHYCRAWIFWNICMKWSECKIKMG